MAEFTRAGDNKVAPGFMFDATWYWLGMAGAKQVIERISSS